MAEFLALRVIAGKLEYKNVPEVLKEQVKQILIEKRHEELVA